MRTLGCKIVLRQYAMNGGSDLLAALERWLDRIGVVLVAVADQSKVEQRHAACERFADDQVVEQLERSHTETLQPRVGKSRLVDGADRGWQSASEHCGDHGAVNLREGVRNVCEPGVPLAIELAVSSSTLTYTSASLPPTLSTR